MHASKFWESCRMYFYYNEYKYCYNYETKPQKL